MQILGTFLHCTLLFCPPYRPPPVTFCGTQMNGFARHSDAILLSGGLCQMNLRSHVLKLNFHALYEYFKLVNLRALNQDQYLGQAASER